MVRRRRQRIHRRPDSRVILKPLESQRSWTAGLGVEKRHLPDFETADG